MTSVWNLHAMAMPGFFSHKRHQKMKNTEDHWRLCWCYQVAMLESWGNHSLTRMQLQPLLNSSVHWSQTGQASEGRRVPDCRRHASLASTGCSPLSLPSASSNCVHPISLPPSCWSCHMRSACLRELHFWQGDCGDAAPSRAEHLQASVTPVPHTQQCTEAASETRSASRLSIAAPPPRCATQEHLMHY